VPVKEDRLLTHLDRSLFQNHFFNLQLTRLHLADLFFIRANNLEQLHFFLCVLLLDLLELTLELFLLFTVALLCLLIFGFIHGLVDSALELAKDTLLALLFFFFALKNFDFAPELLYCKMQLLD